MLCHIYTSQLKSRRNEGQLTIEIDPKQSGQVVLDKVLESFHIIETDFFGLQYQGPKKEALWLNLRNRVIDQINGPAYHLTLRVKFFVQPHLIQQDASKELMYSQAKEAFGKGLVSLAEPRCDEATLCRIVACVAQAEHGDRTDNTHQDDLYSNISKEICLHFKVSPRAMERISQEHSKLQGKKEASAHYFFLKEVSTLPGYGMEYHRAVDAHGSEMNIAVGPEGILLQDRKTKSERMISYLQVRLARHNEKCVLIQLNGDFGEPQGEEECFKLVSRKAAVALYRCITEMHSFYRCDTVCSDVQSQYFRDFKGMFISIFNENSEFGKRYMFDIQRTRQEAYDLVRRKIFLKQMNATTSLSENGNANANDPGGNCDGKEETDNEQAKCDSKQVQGDTLQKENKQLKRRLENVEDSLTCCICMDDKISVVLCPCGHMTCDSCSQHIDQCPLCRSDIERFQKVFHNFGSAQTKISKESEEFV